MTSDRKQDVCKKKVMVPSANQSFPFCWHDYTLWRQFVEYVKYVKICICMLSSFCCCRHLTQTWWFHDLQILGHLHPQIIPTFHIWASQKNLGYAQALSAQTSCLPLPNGRRLVYYSLLQPQMAQSHLTSARNTARNDWAHTNKHRIPRVVVIWYGKAMTCSYFFLQDLDTQQPPSLSRTHIRARLSPEIGSGMTRHDKEPLKNRRSQKETNLPTIYFQGRAVGYSAILVSGRVRIFQEALCESFC